MLKLLEGFDDATVAIESEGEVTHKDYEEVLIPRVKEILETHKKVKCFIHFTEGSTYSVGAMATDAMFGFRHLLSWDKVAIVSDIEWIHKAMRFILPIMPFKIKLFAEQEYDEAKTWLNS